MSNETPNFDVYFDNLQVVHERGPILEENHYYPYGLKMAGISSKAAAAPENAWQYQGTFSDFDEMTGHNDFLLRSYDAQVGRWATQDPYDQFPSPYLGMRANPVSNIDPDGGFSGSGGAIGGTLVGFTMGTLAAKLSGESWADSFAWGAVGYGWGTSMENKAGFFLNVRAFYAGLIGKGGDDVYSYERIGSGRVKVVYTSITVPTI